MEYALETDNERHLRGYDRCFILRLARLVHKVGKHSYDKYCKDWTQCTDAHVSVTYNNVVKGIIDPIFWNQLRGGIYNIDSEIVYLPDLLKEFGNEKFEIVPVGAINGVHSVAVDTMKHIESLDMIQH